MNVPRFLYKYVSLDKRLISGLINHEMWFSDPTKDFNDPYDCRLTYDTDNSPQEIREYLEKVNHRRTEFLKRIQNHTEQIAYIRRYYSDISYQELDNILNEILSNQRLVFTSDFIDRRTDQITQNPKSIETIVNNAAREDIKDYRILCLTAEPNNIVMWAHYSSNHQGVCLKLDTTNDIPFFTFPIKVKYVRQYPKYNYIREYDNNNAFKYIAGTKFNSWRYEKEYRIIKNINNTTFRNTGLLSYDKSVLHSIYFGIHTRDEDIELITNINYQYFNNRIKLYKAKEKQKYFKLDYLRIK
ncbi:hypothetical protein ES708_23718 [subsurface metagenome]